ncbi:MAG: hypothetical protein L0216_13785 [Planctomycetales bacterium]|nr:hypothetical protein [Planctomycetales bacterium]
MTRHPRFAVLRRTGSLAGLAALALGCAASSGGTSEWDSWGGPGNAEGRLRIPSAGAPARRPASLRPREEPRPAPLPAETTASLGSARVLVAVAGEGGEEARALVRSAVERALLERGFRVVDEEQLGTVRGVDEVRSAEDLARLRVLRTRLGVEAVCSVRFALRYLYTRAFYGVQYDYYAPSVAVRTLASDTAEVVAARAGTGPTTADPAALGALAARVAGEAAGALAAAWRAPRAPAGLTLLCVLDGADHPVLEAIVARLRRLPSVAGAEIRSFAGRVAEVECALRGGIEPFLADVAGLRKPALVVEGRSGARLDLRVVAAPPPPSVEIEPPGLEASGAVVVTGRVDDPRSVVRVNGVPVAVAADGTFRAEVPAGAGPIRIEATDSLGNTTVREVRP